MDVHGTHTYDASIDAVLALLRDRDATVAKYESMGHRNVEVIDLSETDAKLHVATSRVVDVEIPGFAKKFLKPTNTMTQTDEWSPEGDGSWDGHFEVEVKGAPIHLGGTMHLRPEGDKCSHDVTIRVDVKVPFVGGKIAEWAGKNDVRRTLDAEFAFNDAWLTEHR